MDTDIHRNGSIKFARKYRRHGFNQNGGLLSGDTLLRDNGVAIEVGSIGVQHRAGANAAWISGIDTVIPVRCERKFKAAWIMFASVEARLTEFLAAKRDIDDQARLRR
jgi:hypothetical protein